MQAAGADKGDRAAVIGAAGTGMDPFVPGRADAQDKAPDEGRSGKSDQAPGYAPASHRRRQSGRSLAGATDFLFNAMR
jgi:hypothetical protein